MARGEVPLFPSEFTRSLKKEEDEIFVKQIAGKQKTGGGRKESSKGGGGNEVQERTA